MPKNLLCECGTCLICRKREYQRAWSAANRAKVRAIGRASYARHKERRKAYVAAYASSEAGKATRRAAKLRWQQENREKYLAGKLARNAIARGKLARMPCEVCSKIPAQMHHDDYSKPLEVRWLCHAHHKAHHAAVRPV